MVEDHRSEKCNGTRRWMGAFVATGPGDGDNLVGWGEMLATRGLMAKNITDKQNRLRCECKHIQMLTPV